MENSLNKSSPLFRITPVQATIISTVAVALFTVVALILAIGHRDERIALLAVVAVVGLAAAAAIFTHPQLGAYILVITLFTNMSTIFTESGLPSINKPLIVFVLGTIVLNHLVYKRPFPKLGQVEMWLFAYGFVRFLSVFGATDRELALDLVVDFAKEFVIVLTIILALEKLEHWRRALWLLVLSAGMLASMSTYQVLTGNYEQIFYGFADISYGQVLSDVYEARLIGPLGDPNFYGLILLSVLPVAIYLFLDEKRLSLRVMTVIISFFIVFTVLNTYSRGAFVALILILGLIALERKISPSLLVGVAVGALLFMPIMPDSFRDRMSSLLDLGSSVETAVYQESSFRGRTSEYISGALMFIEHPLLGVGIGNYPPNYQEYSSRLGLDGRTEERNAHSLYIELGAETGMLGIASFIGFMVALMQGLHRTRKKMRSINTNPSWQSSLISIQMGLAAFFLASMFLHDAYIRYLWLLVALAAAGIHLAEAEVVKVKALNTSVAPKK